MSYLKNVSTSTNGKIYPCHQCDEIFGRNSSRFRHILKAHLNSKQSSKFRRSSETRKIHDISSRQILSQKSQTYPSNQSDDNLGNKSAGFNPKSKNISVQSPIMYECSHCDVRFMKINSLSQHKTNIHGIKEKMEVAKNLTPSPAMNVSFIERSSSVTNRLEFKCKQCDKQYSYRHNLKRHEQSAH